MKSFDARLQTDLFPKKPDAFDQMIKRRLDDVCSRQEKSQGTVVPFPTEEANPKPARKTSEIFAHIGAISAAAILVICTLAVGAIAVLSRRANSETPVQLTEAAADCYDGKWHYSLNETGDTVEITANDGTMTATVDLKTLLFEDDYRAEALLPADDLLFVFGTFTHPSDSLWTGIGVYTLNDRKTVTYLSKLGELGTFSYAQRSGDIITLALAYSMPYGTEGWVESGTRTIEIDIHNPTETLSDRFEQTSFELGEPVPTAEPIPVNTVSVSTVEEFLGAIAPYTEIRLDVGTYDLGAATASYAGDNPYVSFVEGNWADGDRFLKITGVEDLSIRAAEDAECIFTARHCEAVLAAESCSGLTLDGITFRGDETGVRFQDCSDICVERCAFEAPEAIGVYRCEDVKLRNFAMTEAGSSISLYESKVIYVINVAFSNCGFMLDNCTDVLVSQCRFRDMQDTEPSPDGEQGDASYLIMLYGQSGSDQSVCFEDCEICNNTCTFLFSSDGIDRVILSGLKIHDNSVSTLFDFDATSDLAGNHVISDCDIKRNRIERFFLVQQSETTISLSGTSVSDNEIEYLFLGGDYTVSGCAFTDSAVTRWIGGSDDFPDLRTSVHDNVGNTLDDAALTSMTLIRNIP